MNGIHDLGGLQDMGAIHPQKHEPVFHAPWEGRAFALWMAVPGDWSFDADDRYQKELLPPVAYLTMSYYEKVTWGLVELMVKTNLVTRAEIDSGMPRGPAKPGVKVLKAADVEATLSQGFPSRRAVEIAPKFKPGESVRSRNINPIGHTRLPRYARGKLGIIQRDHGVFVFPDAESQGLGEKPQHVYSVRFAARELWGEQASQYDGVYVDLWDDHLDPA